MKAKISIFIIALFAFAFLEPLLTAQPAGNKVELSAYIDVSSDGNATVKIAIQYKGRATFFMTLPKFQPVYLCNETGIGKLNIQNETSSAYFYYNSTITINDDNPGRLVLCYSFPSAVLMAGTRGWFMSPLLWTNLDKVSVYVSLPMAKKITYESPVSTSISGNYRVLYPFGRDSSRHRKQGDNRVRPQGKRQGKHIAGKDPADNYNCEVSSLLQEHC
ncbi:hypothetical protein N186_01560 [Thermofilum adornatum]|uniref:DUF2207 domain-containing protein n=1 Tax=Thermofilum adornatum TaxID=1365176 RepID=S5ZCF9_9CREN|nr:hypothetical protein [Thermofilum adornatum]AGT34708.1 hypothetical protein N186_01560 [Thermofilum adornatum]